jgi:hypothetical protein
MSVSYQFDVRGWHDVANDSRSGALARRKRSRFLVTLRLTIAQPSVRMKNVFVHTFTAVAEGDHWSWILTPSKYELYRSNGCGV